MSFATGDVLRGAIDRLTTPAGAILVIGLTLFGIVQSAASQTITQGILSRIAEGLQEPMVREFLSREQVEMAHSEVDTLMAELPLALGAGPGLAALLWLVGFVLTLAVVIVAIDTFGHERDTFDGFETERLGWKTFNLFVGWFVFWILFLVGMLLFVIPGLLLAFFLVFFAAAIAIDGDSFFAAFDSSGSVVRSNPLGTIAIVIICIGTLAVAGVVEGMLGGALPPLPGEIAGHLVVAVGQAFALALIALAYVQATRGGSDPVVDATEPEDVAGPPGEPA